MISAAFAPSSLLAVSRYVLKSDLYEFEATVDINIDIFPLQVRCGGCSSARAMQHTQCVVLPGCVLRPLYNTPGMCVACALCSQTSQGPLR